MSEIDKLPQQKFTRLDVASNRIAQKWTRRELAARVLWESVGVVLFRMSPRQFWVWRRVVLRIFGARIGRNVHIYSTVKIAIPWHIEIGEQASVGDCAILYSLGRITIGPRATLSQYAHICAGSHDHTSNNFELTKAPIIVAEDTWICADAFVGPGVTIGSRSIVAARAVVTNDIAGDLIVGGNPARPIKRRSGEPL